MINKRITRVILNSTEITDSVKDPGGSQSAVLLTTDALYVGFHGQFASRYLEIGTANTNASVLSVQYWDGDSWEDVDDLSDQTSVGGKTFARNGFISWTNKTDWQKSNQTGTDADLELYWLKFTVSNDLSAGTTIASIINILSDDDLLAKMFPELISDTRYRPSGKTNFLDQHIAAKDWVVLRLKQRDMIEDESQILEPNSVSQAAVYGAACLILKPIATSPDSQVLRDTACQAFEDEIGRVTFPVDSNEDGVISDSERTQAVSISVYRR